MYQINYAFQEMNRMSKITYKTRGVCSRAINVEVQDGIIVHVDFEGGCAGNTKGVAALAEGMRVDEAIEKLSGIKCGFKNTSCPDQLAIALKELQEN